MVEQTFRGKIMIQQSSAQQASPKIVSLPQNLTQAPYSQDVEEALLGTVLVNPNKYYAVSKYVEAQDFYFMSAGYIWRAMTQLVNDDIPIDAVTLGQRMDANNQFNMVGGMPYLTKLMADTPTSAHAEIYAQIVLRLAVRRETLKVADEIKQLAMDQQIAITKGLEAAQDRLQSVTNRLKRMETLTAAEGAQRIADHVEQAMSQGGDLGIPTGIRELDTLIGGSMRRRVGVIGGINHHGKTSVMGTMALNGARLGKRTLFCNVADGNADDVLTMFVGMDSGLPPNKVFSAALSSEEMQRFYQGASRFSELPIYIHHEKRLTPAGLRDVAKATQYEYGLDVIYVDYIQRMGGGAYDDKPDSVKFAYISQELTEIAEKLNVPIWIGAQINRSGKMMQRPTRSHIKSSGSIEEDADVVMIVYKASVEDDSVEHKDQVELIIDKNKQTGQLGTVYVHQHESRYLSDWDYRVVDLGS